jgi:bidirectional [NiFe] hydrogenase diaphorase subunit
VQDTFGYIDRPALTFVARNLGVPLSRAYGVATFYNYFRLRPPGEHTCEVCYGTACYIQGAPELSEAVKGVAGISAIGETSEDGKVSLLTVRCLGCCSNAPVVVYDGTVTSLVTADSVRAQVETWLGEREAPSPPFVDIEEKPVMPSAKPDLTKAEPKIAAHV